VILSGTQKRDRARQIALSQAGIRLIDPIAPFRIVLLASRFRHTREQAGGQMTGNVMSQYR
jgi:hypothetical protein